MRILSDSDIIQKLKSTNKLDNQIAIKHLYKVLYPKVESHIIRNSGHESDVKDIFQNGLLAIYKLVKQDRIPSDTKTEAYVFSICRNLWLKELQNKKRERTFDSSAIDIVDEDLPLQQRLNADKAILLNELLNELEEGCRKIIRAFYYERQSMDAIAHNMNLANEQVAKNKKSKCMKKLKELVFGSDFYNEALR